jgi:hypothetical protein
MELVSTAFPKKFRDPKATNARFLSKSRIFVHFPAEFPNYISPLENNIARLLL